MTISPENSPEVEKLREMPAASRRAVVFSEAGINTESGIPDFRSPGGIWEKYRPIEFEEFMTSEQARREYWRRKFACPFHLISPGRTRDRPSLLWRICG